MDVREFRWETTREAGKCEQEAEEGGGKPREGGGGRSTRGEAERSRQRNWERRDGEVGKVGVEESGRRAGECRYWARRPRERTMVESEASQSREAEDGAGIKEVAWGWITGETEWTEDEAGERERETRGEAVES